MLKNLLSRPLKLTVGRRELTFCSLGDFDFALASRVEVPAAKVSALVRLAPEALQREARSIRKVEKSFADLLARSLEDSVVIGELLGSIDLQSFSSDHRWREIMAKLREQPASYNDYKQLALVKYMQYLAARQDVLKTLYKDRQSAGDPAPEPVEHSPVEPRETVIFDISEANRDAYAQLPRGETIELAIDDREGMPLMLSRHKFRLISGNPFALVDDRGGDFPLRQGKNVLGRFRGNHVVLDAEYRDVSRKHLVIEPVGSRRVRLTDLSSHGTFVPAGALATRPE